MPKDSSFVRRCSLYQCAPNEDNTLLLSILVLARYGRQSFDFFRVVCGGKMNSWRILIFRFRSVEPFIQKLSRVEKPSRIVCTTPLEKDYFYPSVGNIPWLATHLYIYFLNLMCKAESSKLSNIAARSLQSFTETQALHRGVLREIPKIWSKRSVRISTDRGLLLSNKVPGSSKRHGNMMFSISL
jgi:hypothetical protein